MAARTFLSSHLAFLWYGMKANFVGWIAILTAVHAQDSPMDFVTITLNAVADSTMFEGSAQNLGGDDYLWVGTTSPAPFRSIVKFDLSESEREILEMGGVLVSASLQMTRRKNDFPQVVCSILNPNACASAYTMLAPWSEVDDSPANIAAGSNWQYRDFPLRWNTPGGDFVTQPDYAIMGRQTRDTGEDLSAFTMNTTLMEFLIRNPQENHGFMLLADDDDVHSAYDSRECLGQPENPTCLSESIGCCRSGVPPQLILEFMINDMSSTSLPTASPGRCAGDWQACSSHADCCSFLCARSKCVSERPKNTLKESFHNSRGARANRGN